MSWASDFAEDQQARRISGMQTWKYPPTIEQETNDARNTREFFEHRKLCLARISAAIQAERKR